MDLFLFLTFLFMIFGGMSELSFVFASITETDTSFDFLSIEAILSFLMGYGWLSLFLYKNFELPLWGIILGGLLFGFLIARMYVFLMFCIKKLDKNPKPTVEDYLQASGRAYSKILPHAEGQAELTINNKLSIVNVINLTDEEIQSFTPVKVVKYENEKIYIEKE